MQKLIDILFIEPSDRYSYSVRQLYDNGMKTLQLGGKALRIEECLEAILQYLEKVNKEDPIDTGLRGRCGTPIKVRNYFQNGNVYVNDNNRAVRGHSRWTVFLDLVLYF